VGLSTGNLLASVNATLQAGIATYYGGNYGIAWLWSPASPPS